MVGNNIHRPGVKDKKKVVKQKVKTVSPLGGSRVVMQQDFTMKYHKETELDFTMKFKDLDLVDAKNKKEYNLMVNCEGYGQASGEGVFVDLGSSTYEFTNPTPYTLYVRVQRPLGFKDDLASIGAWEPLGDVVVHRVPAGKSRTLHSANHSTSHMGPHQVSVGTKRYIHLLSFSVSREPMSDSGAEPSSANAEKEVGIAVKCVTRYTCMGGDIGVEKKQWRISRERFMDYVHAGPLLPIRIDSLTGNLNKGTADVNFPIVGLQCKGSAVSGYIYCNFIAVQDKSVLAILRPEELDEGTIYSLEHPSLANYWSTGFWGELTLGGFIKYDGGYWYVCQPTVEDSGSVTWNYVKGGSSKTYTSDYIGSQLLRPVLSQTVGLNTKKVTGVIAVKTLAVRHTEAGEIMMVGDWWEKFLSGVVTIIKVTKMVSEILGVLGVVVAEERGIEVGDREVVSNDEVEGFLAVGC